MSVGMVAIKCGMTRQFAEDGSSTPVTVVLASPNRIVQVKISSASNDTYNAIQVAYGEKKPSRVNKALLGHFRKANLEPALGLKEFLVDSIADYADGKISQLNLEQFKPGDIVDVTGVSKGKGYAGVVKRHNFRTQDATHGNSLSHRAPGSTGQRQSPGRVFKNKKMAGRMGGDRCTVQNIIVVSVNIEKHLITLRGGLPGAPGDVLVIKPAVKALNSKG